MRVTIKWNGYNARRYSRPWIAVITDWPIGGKPELRFGGYVGDDDGGVLEIEAESGALLRYGQRDNRGKSGDNCWAVVLHNGTEESITPADAREHWASSRAEAERVPAPPVDLTGVADADLLAELQRRNSPLAYHPQPCRGASYEQT